MQQVSHHDVTAADFDERVISRSKEVPVVVDFWAAWCGPCRTLGPMLERLETDADGDWELVKVDVDGEQELARQFRIQSIPAVKAFRDGKVVAEFVGAQPEANVRTFLKGIAPSAADRLVARAEGVLEAGRGREAEQYLREALSAEPDHRRALLVHGALMLRQGNMDEAEQLLERVPKATPEGRDAQALLARVRFAREAAAAGSDSAGTALAASSSDTEARWALGVRLAAQGDYRPALDHFLWLVQHDRQYREDGGRQSMLAVFDILGPDDPLTVEYRRRLTSALY